MKRFRLVEHVINIITKDLGLVYTEKLDLVARKDDFLKELFAQTCGKQVMIKNNYISRLKHMLYRFIIIFGISWDKIVF